MFNKLTISQKDALNIGNALFVNWQVVDINQFRRGLEVELEHGLVDESTNVTYDDMLITGKIALAHLNELNDYYTRLDLIERVNYKELKDISKEKNSNTLFFGMAAGAAICLFGCFLKNKSKKV